MDNNYREMFAEYLIGKCKYPAEAVRTNIYKYDGNEYGRVEVAMDGYVVQAFVLMREELCRKLDKFPFYRTYYQRNDFGYTTPPECYVVVNKGGADKWAIHSSADLRHERTALSLLNYDEAVKRFQKRIRFIGNEHLAKIIKRISVAFLIVVALYFVAHILSRNGLLFGIDIPLDITIISVFVVMMVLLLLPPLVPYIQSITLGVKGIGLEINQGRR